MSKNEFKVVGTYPHNNGRIEGTIKGHTLIGRWYDTDENGIIRFEFSDDFLSFKGKWSQGNTEPNLEWNGTKYDENNTFEGVYSTEWGDLTISADNNAEENEDNKSQDLDFSEHDLVVAQKLQNIYKLWSGKQKVEETEYLWPNKRTEIKESQLILDSINRKEIENKLLIAHFDEISEQVKKAEKIIPNFPKIIIKSVLTSIFFFFSVMFLFHLQDYSTAKVSYNVEDWIIAEKCYLQHDLLLDSKEKTESSNTVLLPGDKVRPISKSRFSGYMYHKYWIQVETKNGEIGFIYFTDVKGGRKWVTRQKEPFFSSIDDKNPSDSLKAGENVTMLDYFIEGNDSRQRGYGQITIASNFSRVRTAGGKIGYIYYSTCDYPVIRYLPLIQRHFYFPTSKNRFSKEVIGKNLQLVEGRYGPVTSLLKNDGVMKAYLRHVQYYEDNQKKRGVFLLLDDQRRVTEISTDKNIKSAFVDKLPLAKLIMDIEPFRIIRSSFYAEYSDSESKFENWFYDFSGKNIFAKILVWGIYSILILLVVLLFFSLPRLLISPVLTLVENAPFLNNGIVMFINTILITFSFYVFMLWLVIASLDISILGLIPSTILSEFLGNISRTFFFVLIPVLFVYIYHLRRFYKGINYNRCDKCHTMNIAADEGSSYLGQSKNVVWGTYDKLVGRSESSTHVTLYYERRLKKTTELTDYFKDHRACIRCGNRWDVSRSVFKGSKTVKY
ncbi:MAG: hypothetical protein PHR06_04460 [Candidatus Cloacimonetes bacterium]|nr:hypothetical protein [Candidatus Cloacimonadota bacterium]